MESDIWIRARAILRSAGVMYGSTEEEEYKKKPFAPLIRHRTGGRPGEDVAQLDRYVKKGKKNRKDKRDQRATFLSQRFP